MCRNVVCVVAGALVCSLPFKSQSFTVSPAFAGGPFGSVVARRECAPLNMAGGWGKRKKDWIPEELTRGDGVDGDRRGFDAYELQERGDFMNGVREEQRKFLKKKDDEFLMIAKMAGVTDQTGGGVEPMGRFDAEDDVDDNEEVLDTEDTDNPFSEDEDDDEIDVSIRWEDDEEDDEATTRRKRINLPDEVRYDGDGSITRLDGGVDVSSRTGEW
jgi:hypothetical protein